MNMLDWIATLPHWVYIGDCGCQPNKKQYRNSNYPNLELRISFDQVQFQMRLLRNSHDSKVVWVAGKLNFESVYNLHINERKWKNV